MGQTCEHFLCYREFIARIIAYAHILISIVTRNLILNGMKRKWPKPLVHANVNVSFRNHRNEQYVGVDESHGKIGGITASLDNKNKFIQNQADIISSALPNGSRNRRRSNQQSNK